MMTDPIADMLTRIRTRSASNAQKVDMPASKVKRGVAEVSSVRATSGLP